ncbi:hypothetical protein L207DRAFT_629426 [Hyaloscypha variabilis F]|uniref:Extracellular membrane protein CFEM domain-containing protein n=1 Tax=Hyaloscypha variabilis (strain UAMH 11265 / GT02V1 / F) TaxID=1149755 RepID=A0A2J6S275_HYAVF|nr:hypothetical protein L207DRAFT_629426 [Hyaloscypha variabilis F]
MSSKFWVGTALTLAILSSTARAQTDSYQSNSFEGNFTTNWNPSGEGCVDPAGFVSCYATQSSSSLSCMTACANSNKKGTSQYNICVNECKELWLANNVGCWIQSCWNQVYSCGYQLTALSYFDGAGLPQDNSVPFYPPPGDATAGACSCNLGYVYGNLSAVSTSTQGSNCEVISSGNSIQFYDCACCQDAWPISNILAVCPKTDLSILGFPAFVTQTQKALAGSTDKCAILTNGSAACTSAYNFPFAASSVYNPLTLPTGIPGNDNLYNSPGNAFSVFPSAATLTLSLAPSYTSVITPASFLPTASADPQSISGTAILGGTTTASSKTVGSATGSSTGPATTSSTKANSGFRMEGNSVVLLLAAVVAVLGM